MNAHFHIFVAERLSARVLIVQCSRFAFVCMFVYIYAYIRHTLIGWVWFLWSRPQTTSHVVLVQPSLCARAEMEQRPHGAGPARRQSTCENIVLEPKWSRSSPSGNKGTLHQKRGRQRRKSLTDTPTTLRSLSETLQTTALPSSSLYLVPST